MPAPPSGVLTATRAGTCARHLLFYLNHPGGVVRAWDGIGTLSYGGNDYLGVGALGSVQGVSDSRDLQNHEVLVMLGGVPYSDLQDDTGEVRGVAATITAVLLDTDGAVVDARVVFTGKGGSMRTRHDGTSLMLAVRLRGLFTDWSAAPRRFYVPTHQQRLYSGDNGFAFSSALENATVSGWSLSVETTGANARYYSSGYNIGTLKDSVTGEPIGNNTYGFPPGQPVAGTLPQDFETRSSTVDYEEEITGVNVQVHNISSVSVLAIGGVACYVDIYGDVRTPGGAIIHPNGLTASTYRLRKQGTITSNGTATATTLTRVAVLLLIMKTGGSLTGPGMTDLVYVNSTGMQLGVNGSNQIIMGVSPNTVIVEDVSGTIATYASSKVQISGSDCFVSTTGVILSPSNRRLYIQGGSVDTDFLRVWT